MVSVTKLKSLNLPENAVVCISFSERCDVLHYTGEGESDALSETGVKDSMIRVLKFSYDNKFGVWHNPPSEEDLEWHGSGCAYQAIETWKEMCDSLPEHPEQGEEEWIDDPEHPEYINALATYNEEMEALMENVWDEVMEEYQEYWLPLDISIEIYDHKRGCATVESNIYMRSSDYIKFGPFGEDTITVDTELGTLSMAS
tara:strand:- start:223 stop:822 length:600 start_codon:yes stop_codon:yes gene_type:complete